MAHSTYFFIPHTNPPVFTPYSLMLCKCQESAVSPQGPVCLGHRTCSSCHCGSSWTVCIGFALCRLASVSPGRLPLSTGTGVCGGGWSCASLDPLKTVPVTAEWPSIEPEITQREEALGVLPQPFTSGVCPGVNDPSSALSCLCRPGPAPGV